MPVPVIAAAAVAGTAVIASTVISSKAQKSAASKAEALAREQQSQATAEQQRLEEKFGLTPGELDRERRIFGEDGEPGLEAKRQTELERREGLPGEELLREAGPNTRALLDSIAERFGMTGEELFTAEGDIPAALRDQVLAEIQDPGAFFESTLGPELEQARLAVNQEANRRGVFGGTPEGGIRFENLGRAGVDLAIKSAIAKQQARQQSLASASALASQFQNLSKEARGEAGVVGEAALSAKDQARNELDQFLIQMEQLSAGAKGRSANVATNVFGTAQTSRDRATSELIGIQGFRGGIQSPAAGGLSAIGDVAGGVAGDLFTDLYKKDQPTTSSFDELLSNTKGGSDPLLSLSDVTGRRKKIPFIRGN